MILCTPLLAVAQPPQPAMERSMHPAIRYPAPCMQQTFSMTSNINLTLLPVRLPVLLWYYFINLLLLLSYYYSYYYLLQLFSMTSGSGGRCTLSVCPSAPPILQPLGLGLGPGVQGGDITLNFSLHACHQEGRRGQPLPKQGRRQEGRPPD